MSDLAKFAIHLTANPANCRIVMNDYDISHQVQSVNVVKPSPKELPVVVLELLSDDVEITGEGISVLSAGADAVEILDSLNPAELEAQALARVPMAGDLTGTILELVKERFRGAQT